MAPAFDSVVLRSLADAPPLDKDFKKARNRRKGERTPVTASLVAALMEQGTAESNPADMRYVLQE